ncbi:UNKNOWN [Stylonychia lemnae]|uniref:Uncharacterized protein n=1 Tax=Stylonychia lemnae TaxID=5949 RepID=A0A078B918_STYLE|nr:UNKNOWN [Stylonychia lemnae]|eukprot:CDW89772.1 UNKNOWN [Stylonychia lemnae]
MDQFQNNLHERRFVEALNNFQVRSSLELSAKSKKKQQMINQKQDKLMQSNVEVFDQEKIFIQLEIKEQAKNNLLINKKIPLIKDSVLHSKFKIFNASQMFRQSSEEFLKEEQLKKHQTTSKKMQNTVNLNTLTDSIFKDQFMKKIALHKMNQQQVMTETQNISQQNIGEAELKRQLLATQQNFGRDNYKKIKRQYVKNYMKNQFTPNEVTINNIEMVQLQKNSNLECNIDVQGRTPEILRIQNPRKAYMQQTMSRLRPNGTPFQGRKQSLPFLEINQTPIIDKKINLIGTDGSKNRLESEKKIDLLKAQNSSFGSRNVILENQNVKSDYKHNNDAAKRKFFIMDIQQYSEEPAKFKRKLRKNMNNAPQIHHKITQLNQFMIQQRQSQQKLKDSQCRSHLIQWTCEWLRPLIISDLRITKSTIKLKSSATHLTPFSQLQRFKEIALLELKEYDQIPHKSKQELLISEAETKENTNTKNEDVEQLQSKEEQLAEFPQLLNDNDTLSPGIKVVTKIKAKPKSIKITDQQHEKVLVVKLEGVLIHMTSTLLLIRDGIKEGLQLIREKTKGFIQIVLVTYLKRSTLKKYIFPILFDKLGIQNEKLIDLILILKPGFENKEVQEFLDYATQILIVSPAQIDEQTIKDVSKSKDIQGLRQELDQCIMIFQNLCCETFSLLCSNMIFDSQNSSYTFKNLSKSIVSFLQVGKSQLTTQSSSNEQNLSSCGRKNNRQTTASSNGLFMMTVTSISPKNKEKLNFKYFQEKTQITDLSFKQEQHCFMKSYKFIKDHQIFSLFAFDYENLKSIQNNQPKQFLKYQSLAPGLKSSRRKSLNNKVPIITQNLALQQKFQNLYKEMKLRNEEFIEKGIIKYQKEYKDRQQLRLQNRQEYISAQKQYQTQKADNQTFRVMLLDSYLFEKQPLIKIPIKSKWQLL